MSPGKKKVINDPIHGHIELDDYIIEIIDTVPFQRLRDLRQLGSAYFVFPGASHNRFEHCIGVSFLAGVLVNHLRKVQPELGITDQDVKCVKLAGLCHDLGHGPFSHVFDNEIVPSITKSRDWCHEQASEDMLDFIVKEYPKIKINNEELLMIKDLIHGEPRFDYPSSKKLYLFDIVANKRNSIDVDKYDYIQRDCYNVGIKSSLDATRLMKFTRVLDNQICFDHKEAFALYDMFYTRYSLFKRVYSHKVSKAIEYMLTDVFINADKILHIENAIKDMSRYQYFSDSLLGEIERSVDPDLEKSRQIIHRLRRRDLYVFVGELRVPHHLRDHVKEHFTVNALYETCSNLPLSECSSRKSSISQRSELLMDENSTQEEEEETRTTEGLLVREEDIIVEFLHLGYAMRDKNPVDNVRFYNRKTSDMYSSRKRKYRPSSRINRRTVESSLRSKVPLSLDFNVPFTQESAASEEGNTPGIMSTLPEDPNYIEYDAELNDISNEEDDEDEGYESRANGTSSDSGSKTGTKRTRGNKLESFQIRKEQISALIPNAFEEVSVRVFVKRRCVIEEVHKGFLSFIERMNTELIFKGLAGPDGANGLEIASSFYY